MRRKMEGTLHFLKQANHGRRLMRLLVKFVRLQKSKDGGLALCTLLRGADESAQHGDARRKFWAAMEILSQINKGSTYPLKIKRAYEAWMSKTTEKSKKLLKLWYLGVPKEMQLTDIATRTQSEPEKFSFRQDLKMRPEIFPSSHIYDTGNSCKTKITDQCVSNESVSNKRQKSMDVHKNVPDHPEDCPSEGFYMEECANLSADNVSLFKFDHLDGSIPFPEALVAWCQVEETLVKLKKFCHSSNAVIPIRLRANLLECFSCINRSTLASFYEDILEKDPTCRNSLLPLISLHKNGSYKSSQLITMIALHLDATFAAYDIWEEFATCFLNLQTQNSFIEDQMPMDHNERHFPYCGVLHQSFVQDGARRLWKLRIKWWSQHHFSEKACLAELQNAGCFSYFSARLCYAGVTNLQWLIWMRFNYDNGL